MADYLRDYLQSGQRRVQAWQQAFNPARAMFTREELPNFNIPDDLDVMWSGGARNGELLRE